MTTQVLEEQNNIGDWECSLCIKNKVDLVQDCKPVEIGEQPGFLGFDRHGNRYHFLSRRIWVEINSQDPQVIYFSTEEKFNDLIAALDVENYEKV